MSREWVLINLCYNGLMVGSRVPNTVREYQRHQQACGRNCSCSWSIWVCCRFLEDGLYIQNNTQFWGFDCMLCGHRKDESCQVFSGKGLSQDG
jgi:hypothetical protein